MNDTKVSGTESTAHRPSSRGRIIAFAVVIVALVGAAWAVLAARDKPASGAVAGAPGARGMSEMAGMEGMAGMSASEDGSVTITAAQIREFGITFDSVRIRPLTSEIRTSGAVTVDETRIMQVASRVSGFIEVLHADFIGRPVRRGQPLLEIYSPELLAAQQDLLLARELQRDIGNSAVPGVPAGSSDLVEASRRRLRLLDVSDEQIEAVLRTGRARRTLTIYSPSAGVITEKKVVRGQSVMAGDGLFTIADLSSVWIDVQLREADASAVRVGSAAAVEIAGLVGRTTSGRVEFIAPTLQADTRTVSARIAIANTGGAFKPGMYATVRLSTPGRSALTVPSSAILRTGDRNVVFVDMGAGSLMPHEVQLGAEAGDYIEVLSGLERGHRVVTSAQFLLDSESNIGQTMKSMVQMGPGSSQEHSGMSDKPAMPAMPGMSGMPKQQR